MVLSRTAEEHITDWSISAGVGLLAAIPLWALLPREVPVDRNGTIDWFGSFLALGGLILFNVVWK